MPIAAAQNNRKRISKAAIIIQFGTPLDDQNNKSQTALSIAATSSDTTFAEYIVTKAANLCIPYAAGLLPREGYSKK